MKNISMHEVKNVFEKQYLFFYNMDTYVHKRVGKDIIQG